MGNHYNFDVVFQAGRFEIKIDTLGKYGYFEHEIEGDNRAGGLWFGDSKELLDYDGMPYLPMKVIVGLRQAGFTVDEVFE